MGTVQNEPATSQSPPWRDHYFPSVPDKDWHDWRWQIRNRIRDAGSLLGKLPFPREETNLILNGDPSLHFALTPFILSLIDPRDPSDPVGIQFLPSLEEFGSRGMEGMADPLDEEPDTPVEGIVHRYPDRCLFLVTHGCPVYCRHCTRRRKWAEGEAMKPEKTIRRMVDYVRNTPVLRDVLITGGDPLMLEADPLDRIIGELKQIGHVEVVRIGTRVPAALPMRLDGDLLEVLRTHAPLWINTHFNHPREITAEAVKACRGLRETGSPLNNQTVLLRGVNDRPEIILELCRRLLATGVRPYYLFHCDPVRGAAHLRTPVQAGLDIVDHLQGRIGGLGIPVYAVDTGGAGKIPLHPETLVERDGERWVLRNHQGKDVVYGGRARNPEPPSVPDLGDPS
jgi:lysine 2,3-aminomutase